MSIPPENLGREDAYGIPASTMGHDVPTRATLIGRHSLFNIFLSFFLFFFVVNGNRTAPLMADGQESKRSRK